MACLVVRTIGSHWIEKFLITLVALQVVICFWEYSYFSTMRLRTWMKFILRKDKQPYILHSYHNGRWRHGDASGQSISSYGINSLAPGFEWNFRYLIFRIISVIGGWDISCELALRWMSLDLTGGQHWFRQWLGAVRQQAITWANVDPNICRHIPLIGHNELT